MTELVFKSHIIVTTMTLSHEKWTDVMIKMCHVGQKRPKKVKVTL